MITTVEEGQSGFIEVGSVSRSQPRSPASDMYRKRGDKLWQGGAVGTVGVPPDLSDMARVRRGGGDSEDEDDKRGNRRLGQPEGAEDVSAEKNEDEADEEQEPGTRMGKERVKPTMEAL